MPSLFHVKLSRLSSVYNYVSLFFLPICGFIVFDYVSILHTAFASRGRVLQADAVVVADWGNCHRNEHLFLLHFKIWRVVPRALYEMRLAGSRAQAVFCAKQLSEVSLEKK